MKQVNFRKNVGAFHRANKTVCYVQVSVERPGSTVVDSCLIQSKNIKKVSKGVYKIHVHLLHSTKY